MSSLVSCYYAKVISIWKGYEGFFFDFISKVWVLLKKLKNRIEGHQKDYWGKGVPLKNSPFEWKNIRFEFTCVDSCLKVGVEVIHIVQNFRGEVISSEWMHYQVMWHRPKCILKIHKGDMESSFSHLSIFYYFIQCYIVFNASIYSWKLTLTMHVALSGQGVTGAGEF